ncbi:MAG TPA: metallophosphoesterase [Sedimentisphaerales bacterium]|nr:metallophosphoesterase [Sedimentisphaerales bacterium]
MKRTMVLTVILFLAAGEGATGGIRKGPYLIYPGNNTEMMVLWQLDGTQSCTLEWGLDTSCSDGSTVTSEYSIDHQHKYVISGLMPGNKYCYRITADPNLRTGSFRAAPPSDAAEAKFFGYGDTRTNFFDHDMVDGAMAAVFLEDPNYQTFSLLSGDWVSKGELESSWTNEFFNPAALNTRELLANLPINGCIGNHEWDEGSSPPTFFNKYWPYPYVGGYYWSFDYGPVHVVTLDQYGASYAPGSAQYEWLVDDLKSTRKEWRILQFHEPGYSAGHHEDNQDVQNWIQPLCERYGVDIVFAGHNHYYARCDKNGIKHITGGGGGAPLSDGKADYSEYVEVYAKSYHFCKIDVRGKLLDFQAVKPDGTIIDAFSLSHPTIELVGPADGATVDANGAVFSCLAAPGSVSYQLLFGPDAQHIDYLVSDTPEPPTCIVSEFPSEQTWWTIRVRNECGRYFYAEPKWINALNVKPISIENRNTGKRYNYIQDAIEEAAGGDEIVVGPAIWQYLENINFKGKSLTLRSTDPNDGDVVAATIINGGQLKPVVTFSGGETAGCRLNGFTITGGTKGISCTNAYPIISNCRILRNAGNGIESVFLVPRFYAATITNCSIVGNGGNGVQAKGRMTPMLTNCLISGNRATGVEGKGLQAITNCTIVGNGLAGISNDDAIVHNCIIWGNAPPQIIDLFRITLVGYSDVQGGREGVGNIATDPCFVEAGYWDVNGIWVEGDYNLRSGSLCIDAGTNSSIPFDKGDVDSDGNTTELVPWDLAGNLRLIDGDDDANSVVDMGAYEFWPPVEAMMKFTPQALNVCSKGKWVKAHFVLPEGYRIEDVDKNVPAVVEPLGIESGYMNVFVNDCGLVVVEAAFARAEFCGAGIDGNSVDVAVTGLLTSGRRFCGTDTIKVVDKTFEQLAGLASHWLVQACDEHDWCGGFDIDHDSVVNLVDFALLGGCCVEIVKN